MKRYLFLLVIAIFCLPSEGFAQDYGWSRDPWRKLSSPTSESTWKKMGPSLVDHRTESQLLRNRTSYRREKRYIRVPIAVSLRLAEVVADPETNVNTARWIDGSEYVGDIRKGVIKGKGTMKYSEGGKYVGDWSEGRRWGTGLMHYSNGEMYSGKWMWDLPHGKGTFITTDGVVMTGRFQNGVPHGKFIMQAPDGRKYSARWIDGELKEDSIKPLEEKK